MIKLKGLPRLSPHYKALLSETNSDFPFNTSILDKNLEVVSKTLEGSRFISLSNADVVTVEIRVRVLDGKLIGRDDHKPACAVNCVKLRRRFFTFIIIT